MGKKEEAILKWKADVAELEAQKKYEISKVKMQFAISLLKNPIKTIALYYTGSYQNQIYAIQTQFLSPPAELFMETGGLVSKPKDGVLVQLDPGWSYIPKRLTKKLLKIVNKK